MDSYAVSTFEIAPISPILSCHDDIAPVHLQLPNLLIKPSKIASRSDNYTSQEPRTSGFACVDHGRAQMCQR